MTRYYGLYDTQIDGFKAGYAADSYDKVFADGVERIKEFLEDDEEVEFAEQTDLELMKLYGYEVREVSKKDFEKIVKSNEFGLLTVVKLEE